MLKFLIWEHVDKNVKVISKDYFSMRGTKFAQEAKCIIMQQLSGIQLSATTSAEGNLYVENSVTYKGSLT